MNYKSLKSLSVLTILVVVSCSIQAADDSDGDIVPADGLRRRPRLEHILVLETSPERRMHEQKTFEDALKCCFCGTVCIVVGGISVLLKIAARDIKNKID